MSAPALTLTPDQKAEVETLAAVLNAQQIADYFGIGRTTFFALIERDPEIGERYKRGKAKAVGSIAQSLIAKARSGDTACMIFYLKTQGGWRETERIEHAGPDGGPIVTTSARDELKDKLDRLSARLQATGAQIMLTREEKARIGDCFDELSSDPAP